MQKQLLTMILTFLISNLSYAEDMDAENNLGQFGENLIGGYSIGVEYAPSVSIQFVEYETPNTGEKPGSCREVGNNLRCYGVLAPQISNAFGLFITKQYVPDGLLILDWGVDLAFRRYRTKLAPEFNGVAIDKDDGEFALVDNGIDPKLQTMEIDAYSLATRLYGKVGVAPPFFPDIILGTGIGIESIYGDLVINNDRYKELLWVPHIFMQFELVWSRFLGKGSVSSYFEFQANNMDEGSGHISSLKVDDMSSFNLITANVNFGLLKLVLPI